MLIVMLTSFYIVRLLLSKLGVLDYGIFGITAGVITIFLFVSNSISSACQRFFAIELGNKNFKKLNDLWNIVVLIFIVISILILILGETLGVWFLENYIDIPEGRISAAYWVFQFSLFSLFFIIMSIPYNALLIAKEKMNIYAIISIIDIILKLIIVFLINYSNYDNLIFYSFELLLVSIVIFTIYLIYCLRRFKECRFNFQNFNKIVFIEILSFSSWNVLGSFSMVTRVQGVNILLNIFFGPIVNASYVISVQVNSAISTFTNNFYTAVRPQIIKNFKNNFKNTLKLAYKSAKYSFYLIFLLSLPVILETEYILSLWLEKVPSKAIIFSKLIIINSILEVINYPLVTMIQATGDIKKYQLTVSLILLLNLPISLLFLELGYNPEVTFIIMILLTIISFIPRLIITNRIAKIPIKEFLVEVFKPVFLVAAFSIVIPLLLRLNLTHGFNRFIIVALSSVSITLIIIYCFGIGKKDKNFIKKKLNNYNNEFKKKNKK